MSRTLGLGLAVFLILEAGIGDALAQAARDAEAIKAANGDYYAALSARDAEGLDRVWSHDGQVFNIFAANKAPMIGWDAVKVGYEDLFKRFPEISVSIVDPVIRQDADNAVVVGVEAFNARLQNGEALNVLLPVTNTFVKRDGRWLMVQHHTSRPPP
jgi:uncharacterized protein (TIGR02246 family)